MSIGRYDEPRLLYVAPAFALGPRLTDEHRTIHIGLDLFADAGTPVFAPLDGEIAAFNDNGMNQDYGPVIILRHRTDDGTEFFTLYGHLSRESLAGLSIGTRSKSGRSNRDARGGERERRLDAASALAGHHGPARARHRFSRRRAAVATRGVDVALSGSEPHRPRARGAISAAPSDRGENRSTAREKAIGGNLSLSYREPVKVVRGWMQYLFDDEGRRYVDAYNNVPHVGHCHPRVVEAAERQMRVLNTNTRYLNELLERYAEALLATMPRDARGLLLRQFGERGERARAATRARGDRAHAT